MKIGRPSVWFVLRHKTALLLNVILFFGLSILLVMVGLKNEFLILISAGIFGFLFTGFWVVDNWHRLWWRNNE